jgi:hypothetical protein
MLVLYALNLLGYATLRVRSPAAAGRVVFAAARRTGVRLDAAGARRALGRLRGGSCLSRSLAIASLVPGAEVVIGVRPGEDGPVASGVQAHAWVEVDAGPLRGGDVVGREIARVKLDAGNVLS